MGHKNHRRAASHAALTALVAAFPTAFFRAGRKPLKLGIHDDLIARGVAQDVIQRGLSSYCQSVGYLAALKTGAARIDLDGNAVGTITADEASHAAQKLAAADERARVVLANAAKEQARAADKVRATVTAKAQPPAKSPAPARAEKQQQTAAPRPPTGPITKRPPVVVVRKTRRPER